MLWNNEIESKITPQLWHQAAGCITSVKFQFHTLVEINTINSYLSQWMDTDSNLLLGVREIMVNAVEHGNLGIGYKLKSKLLEDGTWLDEIHKRLAMHKYLDKMATIHVDFDGEKVKIMVQDDGVGFDYNMFLSENMDDRKFHGRGLHMAQEMAFEEMTFSKDGSCVTCIGKL